MQAGGRQFREKFPKALGPKASFSVEPLREAMVQQRPLVAARCWSARSASCCSSPAPTSPTCCWCARPAARARDRDSRRDRRRPRPHRPPAADRERRAVGCRRRARPGPRDRRHPRAARRQHRRPAAHRRGRRLRRPRLARARLHAWRSRSAPACSSGCIPALQARAPISSATLKESGGRSGTGLPPEQDALGPGRRRSGAGADPAGRLGAARSARRWRCARSIPASTRRTC